jgi:flagellar secretion chaperone FliS
MYRQRSLVDQYRNVSSAANAVETDPYRIVALLIAGAVERARSAKAALERGDIHAKLKAVQGALGIVEGLRACLDHEAGGDIAGNLDSLYEYIGLSLVEANAFNKADKLDEVATLLGEIEAAWAAIKPAPAAAPAEHVATYG